jgi:membrane-bound lytic murein transglycosylase B
MGQPQFLPSTFLNHAVDEDGDGRRDIWESLPDVFGSAANYLRAIGWKHDEIWGREVQLPAHFDLSLATLEVRKTVDGWHRLGVRRANGRPLPSAAVEGSIILPGGYKGPAFLVYDNFRSILEWNRSILYAVAVGHLSDRIDGDGPLVATQPADDRPMARDEVLEMQQHLQRLGYDAGEPDGVAGSRTRAALREFQLKVGLPPDGYPTAEMLSRLRRAKGA